MPKRSPMGQDRRRAILSRMEQRRRERNERRMRLARDLVQVSDQAFAEAEANGEEGQEAAARALLQRMLDLGLDVDAARQGRL